MSEYREIPSPKNSITLSPVSLDRDLHAEETLPKLLRGLPCYGIENLIYRHEFIMGKDARLVGAGIEGFGFRIAISECDCPIFLKIAHPPNIPGAIWADFLQRMNLRKQNIDIFNKCSMAYRGEEVTPLNLDGYFYDLINCPIEQRFIDYVKDEKMNERFAAASLIGNHLFPQNIPALFGMATYNGEVIGMLREFVEGSPNRTRRWSKFLEPIIVTLKAHKLWVDLPMENSIKAPDGKWKLLDLGYLGEFDCSLEDIVKI